MTTLGFIPFTDSQSITKPPFFNGNNYSYWKNRMKFFLLSIDYDLWDVVEEGFKIPTKDVDGVRVVKPKEEWSIIEKKACSLNAKAINCLFCALNEVEYNRVSICKTAKDIWDKLEITHEGTSQVKETKIDMLVHQYEMFKIDENEAISDMFIRFTNIVNALEGLGKEYSNLEKVKKLLWSLPKQWEPKVTAIQEAKDLKTLSMDELIGSLMTHEIKIKKNMEDEKKKKEKSIALKAITLEVDSEGENALDEDDVAYLSRKYKNFIKRKKQFKKNFSNQKESKSEKSKKDEVICYECKKPGHIRTDCPLLKSSKKSKKKAMKATWDDSDESGSESENEEVANFCFMAHSDKEDEQDDEVTLDPLSYDELFEAFENMQNDLEKLGSKYVMLKKKYNVLTSENKSLLDDIACLKKNEHDVVNISCDKHVLDCDEKNALLDKIRFLEHDGCEKDNLIKLLKKNESNALVELDKAKDSIKKLTIGAQRLDKIIEVGKPYGDKRGLGYIDECSTPSSSKTIFVKASPNMPKLVAPKVVSKHTKINFVPICHYCGVEGHIRPKCFKLKYAQTTRRNFSQRAKFHNAPRKIFSKKSKMHKFVVKDNSLHNVVCFSCGKYGHKSYSCYLSKSYAFNKNAKMKWIPKFVNANLLGPKQVWVPKDQI